MISLDEKKPENVIPLTSPEFLFLLERIDRIEERIRNTENVLRQEIKQEIAGVKNEIAGVKEELKREITGTRSLIWTTMGLMLGALALTATVVVSMLR